MMHWGGIFLFLKLTDFLRILRKKGLNLRWCTKCLDYVLIYKNIMYISKNFQIKGKSLLRKIDREKKDGFTLIELIVTLAVGALVLSVSVAGIVAWVHHADFVRNENYAETIYYAAQAELTRYRSNGQLGELEEYVMKNNQVVPVEDIVVTPAIDREAYQNRLYYLKKDAGSIDEGNPLGGLLAPYIYDGSIMDGVVCVEFDPGDGTVYSVSYSDENNAFTYEKAPGEEEEKEVSLLNREQDVRKKNRVGYYSTDLSEGAPDAVGKTRLDKVQLINEEQLYLKWSLPERYKNIRGFLTYTLEIYEKGKDAPDYIFAVKGSRIKTKDTEDIPEYIVECTEGKTGEVYAFTAYMDADGAMYLVLDAIDYGAAPEKIAAAAELSTGEWHFDTSGLKNSASILQLFPEPEDIYIRVQAQGMPYKTSAWKQSNTSNTMFASMKEETGTDSYTIENARHLYNIRYREKESGLLGMSKNISYRQSTDITWLKTAEKLYHSIENGAGMKQAPLQAEDLCVPGGFTESVPCFLPVPSLGVNSILEVSGSRKYELKDFVLYQETPGTQEPETNENGQRAQAVKPLGLVAENQGKIQGLTVSNIYVEGVRNVGAVCGINSGKGNLNKISVTGRVIGEENTGGIVGLDQAGGAEGFGGDPAKGVYTGLINYAEVSGSRGKTGGIIGSVAADTKVSLCENYGAVKGTEKYTAYIGGITGYNRGIIEDCTSAPKDKPVMKNGELDKESLKGIFVGGIAGYNNKGIIKNSGTEKESKEKNGSGKDAYIIGYRYVGGIVGYNNETVEGDDSGLVFLSTARTNKAQVIGYDYVGGIVGANALLEGAELERDDIPDAAELERCSVRKVYSEKMLVKNWINEGIIHAAGSYAGGIAGYNAGVLQSCTTKINTSSGGGSSLLAQAVLYGSEASYVGGITGCNLGWIHNENTVDGDAVIQVNSVVAGKKYVGGIAGYNGTTVDESGALTDKSGMIRNYALAGGYISGECFAGGYVGLNTTEKLLGEEALLLSKPNEVTADYFAGGVMGALILVPGSDVRVNCGTDNFFGKVEANNAFAGGYVAYTQLLASGGSDAADARAEALYQVLAEEEISGNIDINSGRRQEALQTLAEKVLDDGRNTNNDSAFRLNFIYGGNQGENRFASIKAPIFAGGIIGFNSWNTTLNLQGISNKVQVEATESVVYPFISKEQGETFSFAGGVIGLVTPKATVDNCKNINGGGVTGKGTFTGGIAEVNLGEIRNCTAGSIGGQSNYGGIAGLNTNEGRIAGCTLDGQISGESYLGGIVVRNESIIEGCTVKNSAGAGESAVIGSGEYIGGIAAVSRLKKVGDTEAVYPNQIKGCLVEANIGAQDMGQYVGGLLGKYEGGELGGSSTGEQIKIYGNDYVGGIAGSVCSELRGEKAEQISNHGEVIAANAAGGIAGDLSENAAIIYCANSGKVSSTQGKAGGIVPEVGESNAVRQCTNSGNISAVREMAGGITAENYGRIEACITSGDNSAALIVEGVNAVGGIAGDNRSEIENCTLAGNVTVRNVNDGVKGREIGGIAGRNVGRIVNRNRDFAEETDKGMPEIISRGDGNYLGGVAGINISDGKDTGIIESDGKRYVMASVALGQGQSGTVGGVVGVNAGTVRKLVFSGSVAGTEGSQYGTGGIAGRNNLPEADRAGVIEDCFLSGGSVSASGAAGFGGFTERFAGVYVGGICGINPEKGTIKGCGLKDGAKVSGNNGYVGGITGYNFGELIDNVSDAASTATVFNSGGSCVMGGIAGYNGADGRLENCATGKWTVNNRMTGGAEKFPTGGVIGCNQSVNDQKGLINRAAVSGDWMSGGIIGLQQTERRGGFTIEGCENHGEITGRIRTAGGIISDWRYQNGRVRECINYGKISIEAGDGRNGAGGIIGTGWWGGEVSITIERCGNEGEIFHHTSGNKDQGKAAGIFGAYNSNSAPLTLTIMDCYNAGVIQNTGANSSAGIFGGNESAGTIHARIVRCINYGKGTNSGKTFAGIAYNKASNTTWKIDQCLNIGECSDKQNPIILPAGTCTGENYYFSNPATGAFTATSNQAQRVARRQGNSFKAENSARFDTTTQRLYFSGNTDKYLQFQNVTGSAASIADLKKNFSAPNQTYALLLYGRDNVTKLNPPTLVVLSEEGGICTVSYEADQDTAFCTESYELVIYGEKENGDKTELKREQITDTSKNTWKISEGELFGADKISYVEIWAEMQAKTSAKTSSGTKIADSDWKKSDPLAIKSKLPMPEICFEVVKGNDTNRLSGYWVLNNAGDYASYNNWEVVIEGAGNIGGNLHAGRVKSGLCDYGTQYKTITAYAYTPDGSSRRSDDFNELFRLFSENATLKAERVNNDNGELIGLKAGELSYKFRMRQAKSNYDHITYRADFLLNGTEMGYGIVELPLEQGQADCTIDLSALTQDQIRQIIDGINNGSPRVEIRYYPLELDSVKYYTTNADGTISRTVLEAGNGAFQNSLTYFDLSALKDKYRMHPVPVPGSTIEMNDTDGTITYRLHWDAAADIGGSYNAAHYQNARYKITVTGKDTLANTQVVLYQQEVTAAGERDRTVLLTEDNWKYQELLLTVERIGSTGNPGYIGAVSEKTYPIPMRLNAVPKPTANLPDQNNLIYQVNWLPSVEKDAAKGYRILIKGKNKDGTAIPETSVDVDGVDTTGIEIDLTKYPVLDNAETIEFSIVVLSGDSSKYLDSRPSPGVVCEIPERLPEPEGKRTLLLEGAEVDENIPLETEKFAQFELKQTDQNASAEDAVYEVEYFITDADEIPADWDKKTGAMPEQDKENGIYISTGPVRMTGNLQEASYLLQDLDADQAGRRLWFRIRGVSNNKVSSIWTVWESLKLPKATLKTVEMEEQAAENKWSYTITQNGVTSGDSHEVSINQPKLRFGIVDFAAGYEVRLKEADRTVEKEDGTQEVITGGEHAYTLHENPDADDDMPLVLMEGSSTLTPEAIDTDADITTYAFALYDIGHTFRVESSGTTYIYEITTTAKLFYSVKDGEVQEIWLELPEGMCLDSEGNEIGNREFVATAAVDVTVIPPVAPDDDPDDPRYVVENLIRWQRVEDPDDPSKNTTEIKEIKVSEAAHSIKAVQGYFLEEVDAEEAGEDLPELFRVEQMQIEEPESAEDLDETEKPEDETEEETGEEESAAGENDADVSGNDIRRETGDKQGKEQ